MVEVNSMDIFLIHNPDNTYQEVLRIECVAKASNKNGSYKYKKKLFNVNEFEELNLRDSYELKSLEDIQRVEEQCKRELLYLVVEQRARKIVNHRAQILNYILYINHTEVFNMKQELPEMWKMTIPEIEEKINGIKFTVIGNGEKYDNSVGGIKETTYLV